MSIFRILNSMIVLTWLLMSGVNAWADDLGDAKRAYGAGDFEEASALLRPLAREGRAEALYLLGRMYEQGDGVTKDENEAKQLFKRAADKGHENAAQRLALYENADSGEESVVLEWYLPAAEEGDMEAQYNLGFMYETGWGVGIDEKKAAGWYKEAADLQHDQAQLRLGMMYIVGRGVEKDPDQGIEILRLAAENGNRVAEVLIQEVFDSGEADQLDVDKIIRGLRRSIDEGEPQALKVLNNSLDRARRRMKRETPVARSSAPSAETKKPSNSVSSRSSDKVSSAQFNIAKAMDKGMGVPKNDPEMVKWYITSARQGNADAQFNLGILYMQGRGVSKDVQEGMRWFNAAASQGHELSKDYLQLWNDELDNATLGGSIAITWLKENARNWDLDSLYMMGQMFETGRGVNRNLNEAKIWYRLAAEAGHKEARRQLDMVGRGNITTTTPKTVTSTQAPIQQQETITTGKAVTTQFDWFWMILGFAGIAGLGFVFYILFRRSGGKMPGFASTKRPGDNLFDAPNQTNVSNDDAEFLKGLWDDDAIGIPKPPKPEEPAAQPEKAEEGGATEVFKAVTWGRGGAKRPIISEDDIELPDIRAVMSGEEVKDEPTSVEPVRQVPPVKHVEPPVSEPRVSESPRAVKPVTEDKPIREESAPDVAETKPVKQKDVWEKSDSQVVSADDISSVGISRDALAAGRVSADSLFGENQPIDREGKSVPSKAVPFDEAIDQEPEKQSGGPIDFADLDLQSIRKGGEQKGGAGLNIKSEGPVSASMQIENEPEPSPPEPQTVEPVSVAAPLSEDVSETRSLAEVHYNIGVMFASGDGAPRNDVMAAKWFLKAAEEGLPEAQFRIGEFYLSGTGIEKNPALGKEWIQKAAGNGDPSAQAFLTKRNQA